PVPGLGVRLGPKVWLGNPPAFFHKNSRGFAPGGRRPAPGPRGDAPRAPRPPSPQTRKTRSPFANTLSGAEKGPFRPGPPPCEGPAMLNSLTTSFIYRLRAQDEAAWFELWETFGPVLRAQLAKWGKGRIGPETVRDLSQETLAALSNSIDRYDPARGARFSTWLLAIAKHVLGDEMDRRSAQKRGGNRKPAELDESWMVGAAGAEVDQAYEAAVFRAKVEAAIRMAEREADFTDFSIYRMRV